MTLEQNSKSRACYVKTSLGLWICGDVDLGRGVVSLKWQRRFKVRDGIVSTVDFSGAVIGTQLSNSDLDFGDHWVVAGEIDVDGGALRDVPFKFRSMAMNSISIHMARLTYLGYGKSPSEVVTWFEDMKSLDFVVPGQDYIVENGEGAFRDIEGFLVAPISAEDGKITAKIVSEYGDSDVVELDDELDWLWFLLSCNPVI